ncbi:growth factor receptor-bound protein 10-like isoform X3 [Harmonia axyridis]|uniref:growth factor receptor-bound protein 10-like isoform X3 n=1 Tax=Harmonia axyridis TaxID=115357 RepID=UPI001E2754EC|nr:growth factor receptor-bound protein 10-like isoform X3 [Harmonia axyridis]
MSVFFNKDLIASINRLIGIQNDPDVVCERCSTTTDGECMCASPYPYRRLDAEKNERAVKITFHKQRDSDEGKVTMEVERNMCVLDLCKIVAIKMEYQTTAFWSLVEYWVDKNAERVLEEHEIMVEVYNDMMKFKRRATVRYVLRQDISKFDFLSEPTRIRSEGSIICEGLQYTNTGHVICYIENSVDDGRCPVFFSRALMRRGKDWEQVYLLLKDRRLYYSAVTEGQKRMMELGDLSIRKHFYSMDKVDIQDIRGLVLVGEATELQVYRVTREGGSAYETNAFLLRPTATPAPRTSQDAEPVVNVPVLPKSVIRFTSLSSNFATTWIALMRLAKYGKQLRENYRAFKNKNDASSREFSRANVPNRPQSPLFRRMGCREHLGERANFRRSNHDHLALLDFSGRSYGASSRLSEMDPRRNSTVFFRYMTNTDQKEAAKSKEGTISRLTSSIRRKLHIGSQQPTTLPSALPATDEPQPSTSRDIQAADPVQTAEKGKMFGAIRKIFSPKPKKSGKRRKSDERRILPRVARRGPNDAIEYIEYVSDERSSQEYDTAVVSPNPEVQEVASGVSATITNDGTSSTSGNETQPPILERESIRSRVAMDFTGKQGRIVEDPVEANEIALAEGYMWKRRHKVPARRPLNPKLNENHVDVGIHTMQPWFHSNLTRDQASSLVTRYGEGDGVFIVRPSRTSEGTYVLTYKCQGKLAHQQIVPIIDKERNITVFTLDNGLTKFYDILQLVEFYTVNLGPLMCRLTHYITENANIQNPNVPSPSNAPKYVNVAVNTDISIHSTEQTNLLESPSGSSKTTSSHSLSSR